MKQEIICDTCKEELRKLFQNDNPYEGEHVKFVSGIANHEYICDNAGETISANTHCWAFSAWADYGGQPYYPWEKEFIIEEDNK